MRWEMWRTLTIPSSALISKTIFFRSECIKENFRIMPNYRGEMTKNCFFLFFFHDTTTNLKSTVSSKRHRTTSIQPHRVCNNLIKDATRETFEISYWDIINFYRTIDYIFHRSTNELLESQSWQSLIKII